VKNQQRIDAFWQAYYSALAANVQANPQDYAMRPGETSAGYAGSTAAKMQRAVESKGGFANINYTTSKAFRVAARAVGVPFNKAGLDSIYSEE
jgi:hypothetical protein